MNLALVRKDLHLFRLPLAASLLLALLPYAFAAGETREAWQWHRSSDRPIPVMLRDADGTWREGRAPMHEYAGVLAASRLVAAALAGLGLAAVSAAAYGGMAFAAERRDGSAEFLKMLPVSPLRIAVMKSATAAACMLAPALLHGTFIAAWCWAAWPVNAPLDGPGVWGWMRDDVWNSLAVVTLLFGVAWLASAFMARPAVAAVFAIEVAVVLLYAVMRTTWQVNDERSSAEMTGVVEAIAGFLNPSGGDGGDLGSAAQAAARVAAVVVGASAFVAGTVGYARRVRP